MIPILFNKDEKTFTSLGLGQMDATLVEVERERNGNYTLYAEVPFSSPQAKQLTKEMLIKADAGSRTKWQTFKINRTIKDTNANVIKVYADHISMDTINDAMKPKVVIRQQTAEGALRQWASNLVSGKAYDVQSDITYVGSTEWTIDEVENARQALGGVSGSILDVWGGEFEFDNNRIILHKEMGREAPTVLEYGRNIVSLEYEELIDGVYTSIYPYATYTPKSEGNRQQEPVMVTLDELIVDSEYAGNYETRRIQIVDFSNEFDSNAENPEIPTQAKLRTLAKAYVKNNGYGIPKISQEIDFVDLSKTLDYQDIQVMEEIELNDRVPVYYPNIDAETNDVKVTTTNWDVLNNRYSKITLSTIGAMNTNSITSKLNTAIKDLKAEQKKINNTVPYLLNSQGNRIWHTTPDDNMEHKLGDTWFKKNGKYTVILRWNGSMWEEVLNDETFVAELEAEIQDAISKAEDAKDLAISEAESALSQAKADATAKVNAIHEQISGEVNTAISTAEDAKALAISEAENALSQAKADATAKANAVKTEVSNSVNAAINTANDAKQTAIDNYNNAVAEAERLVGEQTKAFDTKFDEIEDSVNAFNESVSDVDAKADEALEKAGANANLLTTHQNTIDTINTVTLPDIASSAGTALANAKDAMDEAKKADDKIANFVKTNGLVSGTVVDTKINDATGEISKTIRTVEGKIPTEVGARNYVINSNFASEFSNWHVNNSGYVSLSNKVVKASGFAGAGIFATINNTSEAETYTISVYIKGTGSIRIGFESDIKIIPIPSKDNFTRIIFTTVKGASSTFVLYTNTVATVLEFKNIQIEKGSILTDWKLAPEDNYTQEEFKIFESTYSEDVKGIRSSLSSLSNDKLDGLTYTTFYKNEYEKTAEKATDAYTKIGKVVDANGNTTDTFAKAVYDQNATRRTEDFTAVTSGLVTQNTFTTGINGLSGSISTISGQLDKLKAGGGGRNYALKSNAYYYTTDYKVSEYDLAKIPKGTKIKVSVWGALSTNVRTFRVYINNGNGTASGNSQIIDLTKLDGIHGQGVSAPLSKWTAEATLNVDATKILVFGVDDTSSSPKRIEYVKVETGETFTDWTVAPEDMLGKADFQVFKTTYEANDQAIKARLLAVDSGKEGSIAYRLNETEKTASGNTTTISDIKTKPGEQITGYQTIKERSDLYERVIGKDEAGIKSNMARMVMTDSLFKTEVIKNVPSSIGGRNYVLKSNEYYYTNNYKVAEYDLSTIPKGTKIKISLWGGLGSTVRTFGVYVNNSSGTASGNSQIIELKKLDGVFGQGVSVPLAKWTAEATLNVDAKKILIYGLDNNNSSPKRVEYAQIETGDYYTDWTAAPEDKANMSSITQLENSIALKVSNENLLSQINLQAGGVLIQSGTNKLNITPETTYIKDATIKSAMIDTVNVKQLTGITADFTSMVTKALTANTITSTMLNADEAMFTKLFATSMATDKLVAQGAWITNANIVSLDAGTIKSGTIDSARIDAGYIVTNGLSTNVIKSEHINATVALVNKIFSEEAYINALTSKAIFANKIKAIEIDASKITSGELAAARIKSKDVVTQGLTANVVQSTHIKAEAGLVGKLFSTTAYIEELTNKTTFTEKIQAINISADKITTGTFDASKAKIINLDANNITTGNLKSINIVNTISYPEGGRTYTGDMTIAGGQISSYVTAGSGYYKSIFLTDRTIRLSNQDATMHMRAGNITFDGTLTGGGQIWYQDNLARLIAGSYNGFALASYRNGSFSNRLSVGGWPGEDLAPFVDVHTTMNMRYNKIENINGLFMKTAEGKTGATMYATSDNNLSLGGTWGTVIGHLGSDGTTVYEFLKADQASDRVRFAKNINMQGNTILNQSDERLKHNIHDLERDDLSILKDIQYKNFTFNNQDKETFGFIAQDIQKIMPSLIMEETDGYLSYDSMEYTHFIGHALQQHVTKVDDEITQLKAQVASLQDELALLKGA